MRLALALAILLGLSGAAFAGLWQAYVNDRFRDGVLFAVIEVAVEAMFRH